MQHYSIKTELKPYHDHNGKEIRPEILSALREGKTIALISDAGMPLISDPGYKLVEACRKHNLPVFTIPGASATLAALSVSGLPTNQFYFVGFLPQKKGDMQALVTSLQYVSATLIFFERGSRLVDTLTSLRSILGDRNAVIARELTKKFETVLSGTFESLIQQISQSPPKGEIVLLVDGADVTSSTIDVDAALLEAMQTISLKDAVQQVTEVSTLPKKEIYQRALALKDKL